LKIASATQIKSLATEADNEIRMILLGRTGTGKRSVGNTILGEKYFKSGKRPIGVTTKCAYGAQDFEQKRLFLVDTPGFLDPNIAGKAIQCEFGTAYE
ncbi:unnamed protein product, partial [Rotaria magnacalcarata]